MNLLKTSIKPVENLNETINNAKNGKGAINYLSNDANLVKNIDSTMNNLNQASVLLNQNLEALKHNIFFRGYFKNWKRKKKKLRKPKNNHSLKTSSKILETSLALVTGKRCVPPFMT